MSRKDTNTDHLLVSLCDSVARMHGEDQFTVAQSYCTSTGHCLTAFCHAVIKHEISPVEYIISITKA